ncbi:MAG: hypothetical protein ACFE0P_03100 [Oceanicaulis sp.]
MPYGFETIILVTGAPRTGTTPVGNLLAAAPGAHAIYEPWGPTGDRRFLDRFPIFPSADTAGPRIQSFLDDLSQLKLKLKPQTRPYHAHQSPFRRAILAISGTRTLSSLRAARFARRKKTLIWKDPNAILALPDILDRGIEVVVTVRPALAHAASYKRLGWSPDLADIYPRYARRYGPDFLIEDTLGHAGPPPAVGAAALWRMAYSLVARQITQPNLSLVHSNALAKDEEGTYKALFGHLKLDFEAAAGVIRRRRDDDGQAPRNSTAVHDWNRPVFHTNTYWKDVLDPGEIDAVIRLTDGVL